MAFCYNSSKGIRHKIQHLKICIPFYVAASLKEESKPSLGLSFRCSYFWDKEESSIFTLNGTVVSLEGLTHRRN